MTEQRLKEISNLKQHLCFIDSKTNCYSDDELDYWYKEKDKLMQKLKDLQETKENLNGYL